MSTRSVFLKFFCSNNCAKTQENNKAAASPLATASVQKKLT